MNLSHGEHDAMTSDENAKSGAQPSLQQNERPEITLTETPMTDGERIRLGEQAGQIVENPVWGLAFSNYLRRLQNQITDTEAHEVKARESLYLKQQILLEVHDELAIYIVEAARLNEEALQRERATQSMIRANENPRQQAG